MKKVFLSCILALILLSNAALVHASENPLKQLTGTLWMKSTEDNKLALIFGVECAVSMEYAMAEHKAKQNDADTHEQSIMSTLSPFAKNWIKAFKDVNRSAIVNEIDAWYTAHPEHNESPVFKILWKEIIQPKLMAR